MTWNPLEVYHSAYLFRCFCFDPNHPSKTTTVLDFSDEQSDDPETSIVLSSGKCHLYNISGEDGGIVVVLNALDFGPLANSADRYKLTRKGEEATEEPKVLGTKFWLTSRTGKLTLGTGTRFLVTNDKFASLETEMWETQENFESWTELDNKELDCSEVEQVSDDLKDWSSSENSTETEAKAATAAAITGLWMIPDKEPILNTQEKNLS